MPTFLLSIKRVAVIGPAISAILLLSIFILRGSLGHWAAALIACTTMHLFIVMASIYFVVAHKALFSSSTHGWVKSVFSYAAALLLHIFILAALCLFSDFLLRSYMRTTRGESTYALRLSNGQEMQFDIHHMDPDSVLVKVAHDNSVFQVYSQNVMGMFVPLGEPYESNDGSVKFREGIIVERRNMRVECPIWIRLVFYDQNQYRESGLFSWHPAYCISSSLSMKSIYGIEPIRNPPEYAFLLLRKPRIFRISSAVQENDYIFFDVISDVTDTDRFSSLCLFDDLGLPITYKATVYDEEGNELGLSTGGLKISLSDGSHHRSMMAKVNGPAKLKKNGMLRISVEFDLHSILRESFVLDKEVLQ